MKGFSLGRGRSQILHNNNEDKDKVNAGGIFNRQSLEESKSKDIKTLVIPISNSYNSNTKIDDYNNKIDSNTIESNEVKTTDNNYISKANGKTLLTAEIANKFGFKEDYDHDGSINISRLESIKFFKETMNKPLTQYNMEASLPNYTDSNNESFADMFPGAKKK